MITTKTVGTVSKTLAALEQALADGGACSLDPRVPDAVWRAALVGPAHEFLSRPGKQLRSAMVRIGWILAGRGDPQVIERLGLVVELLHAGSLVIDDVEDGALERRGAPALHQLVGVPLAINTGSWMYFWALAEIANLGIPPADELAIHRAANAMLVRCHQGQALDLASRVWDLALGDVAAVAEATTRLKTGALCAFATSLAVLAAGVPREVSLATQRLGVAIGTALQMLDDLGSLTDARREKGREDLRHGRVTWPWAWLVEQQPFAWSRLVAQARSAQTDAELDRVADALAAEVTALGRTRIRSLIDDALADLAGRAGDGPAFATVGALLSRMENSYG